ncbi:MAG: ImmA/IrrE family metallo-endopeptidase [Syntrophobacteraceae bacterium]
MNAWLLRNKIPFVHTQAYRKLRACLIAKAGNGILFLDGGDPEKERCFSLAHELAHFLCDYLEPREKALECMGERVRDVLDGIRLPTVEERLSSLFRGVHLGAFVHMMDRSPEGKIDRISILEGEDRADTLALELLAPEAAVLDRIRRAETHLMACDPCELTTKILGKDFGLPNSIASQYAMVLIRRHRSRKRFKDWLGLRNNVEL